MPSNPACGHFPGAKRVHVPPSLPPTPQHSHTRSLACTVPRPACAQGVSNVPKSPFRKAAFHIACNIRAEKIMTAIIMANVVIMLLVGAWIRGRFGAELLPMLGRCRRGSCCCI